MKSPKTALILIISTLLWGCNQEAAEPAAEVAYSAMSYMHFGAHSDDQSGMFSTMARFSVDGDSTGGIMVITDSGGGGNSLPAMSRDEFVEVRKQELIEAMRYVGVESTDQDYQGLYDFYYTLFAEEAASIWRDNDPNYICKIIDMVRKRKPEVLVGMWPAPGTHGQHQWAGRIAITAYNKAGDPSYCAGEYPAYQPKKLYVNDTYNIRRAVKFFPVLGENLITIFNSDEMKNGGQKYSDLNQKARRTFISQGWQESTVREGDEGFLLLASRVPVKDPATTTNDKAEDKYLFASRYPDGTTMEVRQSAASVALGRDLTVTVELYFPENVANGLSNARLDVKAPAGFNVDSTSKRLSDADIRSGAPFTVQFTATPTSEDTVGNLQRLLFTLVAEYAGEELRGDNFAIVGVTAPVEGEFVSTYEIANFHNFSAENNIDWLNLSVPPRVVLLLDQANTLNVKLVNNSGQSAQSTVSLGFVDENGAAIDGMSDIVVAEPIEVPPGGRDYAFELTPLSSRVLPEGKSSANISGVLKVTTAGGLSTQVADIYLVPSADVSGTAVAEVSVDADLSDIKKNVEQPTFSFGRKDQWSGRSRGTGEDSDIGVRGYMTYDDTALYLALEITDDYVSCGRTTDEINAHWLTDSIEIGVDRRQFNDAGDEASRIPPQKTGDAALFTARTFKVGIFPCTRDADGNAVWGARAARDADANQGLVNVTGSAAELAENTAPGFEVSVGDIDASGKQQGKYNMEVKIPWAVVPSRGADGSAMPNPTAGDRVSVNVLVYEYDESDISGTTGGRRLGWSSVRGDQQAVPYIWPEIHLK
ncbi:PIG-L family deacetylase [Woeseia oceani]|nr:PIG-L family deacetylase [Woeseia oceani]